MDDNVKTALENELLDLEINATNDWQRALVSFLRSLVLAIYMLK